LSDGARLCAALDLLIDRALGDTGPQGDMIGHESLDGLQSPTSTEPAADSTPDAPRCSPLVCLVDWFDKFCRSLPAIHPTAIEMVRMRVDGYSARDIAGRLQTGVRLVRRVLADTRSELEQARRRD
jgi:hypothetical protein